MEDWSLESIKTIAIFATSFVAFTNLIIVLADKILSNPRLELIIESAKIIEDYPGELGAQINIAIRAYNGIFFLKEIKLVNSSRKVDQRTKKIIDIYEYLPEDIIRKHIEGQKNAKSSEIKKEEKLDQFRYYSEFESGKTEIRRDKTTRNFIEPNIESTFQSALENLCEKPIREGGAYRKSCSRVKSIRDLKIDKNVSFSFTVFAHIYGGLDRVRCERQYVPLEGWSLIVTHSKRGIKKKLKAVKISYDQVTNFMDSKQDLGGE